MPLKFNLPYEEFINCTDPEVAYMLGFIWADGHVNHNSIILELLLTDIKELHQLFLRHGNWNLTSRKREGRKEQGTLLVTDRRVTDFLKLCNYLPKSIESSLKILSEIPKELHRYWFLGLADGDGCWHKTPGNSAHFSICSNKNQDWAGVSDLFEDLEVHYKIYRNDRYSCIRVCSLEKVKIVGNYLYNGHSLGLTRKREKWEEIKNSYKKSRIHKT